MRPVAWNELTELLTLSVPTRQNDQKHSNNSSVVADKLFQCVWPFGGVDAERIN